MTAKELRQKFLQFFQSKEHSIIPSASLIPAETDPTVLFTTAGMHPLVPYLLGENHPSGKRIVSVQKCVRTVDIDEVGDNRHLTFFEMMGNWSFGDYFKREAIEWSFEFLTNPEWLGLDPKRIYVTVFRGENGIPRDQESIKIWQAVFEKVGISSGIAENAIINKDTRIVPLGINDNFWIASSTGPCGPDTEMFYDTKPEAGEINDTFHNLVNGFRLIEIWNDVFMEFNRTTEGKYEALKQKNVDTGMGIERTLAVLNDKETVFETELFEPIFKKISELSTKSYEQNLKSYRIIADHLKAATFILADGVEPLNVGRGYVLRRLIRRAIRHGKLIGINKNFVTHIASIVVKMYKDFYPELEINKNKIFAELEKEEDRFRKTLNRGLNKLYKYIDNMSDSWVKKEEKNLFKTPAYSNDGIADVIFDLYQTDGFPLELVFEELRAKNINFNKDILRKKFQERFEKHQKKSRRASAGQFKGGLAEASIETARLHTATHLLLAALREVLGPHVYQKGSNINPERLRLDFAHNLKMTKEELEKAENRVNEIIQANIPVECQEMTLEEAKKIGALGVFEAKYHALQQTGNNKVKVYSVDNFSKEICGGPHAKSTGELGHFKIVKEEASSAGVRRIKAVLK